jgi:hypothetical protein
LFGGIKTSHASKVAPALPDIIEEISSVTVFVLFVKSKNLKVK